jgi:hypothetical protein
MPAIGRDRSWWGMWAAIESRQERLPAVSDALGFSGRARGKIASVLCAVRGRRPLMVATVATVAYLGLEARAVEVQVQLSAGLPAFVIVGLPDKAVAESRERVRAALSAIGLALPPKRITVNLSPPTFPRKGRISTCRSRWACWRRSVRPTPKACRTMSRSASWGWTGGSPHRPACSWPRSMPVRRAWG